MAKERVFTYRNTGTEEVPVWEKWYGKTVADAVMMSDADSETNSVANELSRKVDKVSGKQLSTEDYTTAEKTKLAGLQNFVHPNSGVTAGTYQSVTVNAQGHVTAGTNPTTLSGYGITDAAAMSHTHGNADITALDAGKITSGTISIERLPKGALERCVVVVDDAARLKLTMANAQTGDTVKVSSTGLMYLVVDDTKLSTEAGYEVYTAGSATSVPWSGVTGKPDTFPATAHSHDDKYYTEAEMDTKLGNKVDKVSGKQLSTEDYTTAEKTKLAGLQNFVHPSSHPASMITQDASHRFVTDTEKTTWNGKAEIYFASELPTSAPVGSVCFLI